MAARRAGGRACGCRRPGPPSRRRLRALDHHASGKTVTVKYTTSAAGGTATAGADYTTTAGTLTFGPNQVKKVVLVPIKDDALGESNETFTVKLSGVAGPAVLTDPTGLGTILDDDPGPPSTSCRSRERSPSPPTNN